MAIHYSVDKPLSKKIESDRVVLGFSYSLSLECAIQIQKLLVRV